MRVKDYLIYSSHLKKWHGENQLTWRWTTPARKESVIPAVWKHKGLLLLLSSYTGFTCLNAAEADRGFIEQSIVVSVSHGSVSSVCNYYPWCIILNERMCRRVLSVLEWDHFKGLGRGGCHACFWQLLSEEDGILRHESQNAQSDKRFSFSLWEVSIAPCKREQEKCSLQLDTTTAGHLHVNNDQKVIQM